MQGRQAPSAARAALVTLLLVQPILQPPAEAAARNREVGHRLPAVPARDHTVPRGGWDLRFQNHVEALADHVFLRTVRIESFHVPPAPYDPRHRRMEDGAGLVLEPGRLLTTARYLEGADEVRVVRRDGRPTPARVERLDPEANLAVVTYDPSRIRLVRPNTGFAPIPAPGQWAVAGSVAVPTALVGVSSAVHVAAIQQEETGEVLVSGAFANGMPAFDTFGRVVALADRPSADRLRTIARPATDVEAWLAPPEPDPEPEPEAAPEPDPVSETTAEAERLSETDAHPEEAVESGPDESQPPDATEENGPREQSPRGPGP